MLFLDENLFKFKKEEMTVLQTIEEKITNFPLVGLLGSRIKGTASQIPFPEYMNMLLIISLSFAINRGWNAKLNMNRIFGRKSSNCSEHD